MTEPTPSNPSPVIRSDLEAGWDPDLSYESTAIPARGTDALKISDRKTFFETVHGFCFATIQQANPEKPECTTLSWLSDAPAEAEIPPLDLAVYALKLSPVGQQVPTAEVAAFRLEPPRLLMEKHPPARRARASHRMPPEVSDPRGSGPVNSQTLASKWGDEVRAAWYLSRSFLCKRFHPLEPPQPPETTTGSPRWL